jgi:hypothetical protein
MHYAGVDFSGAADAGRKIWVAEVEVQAHKSRLVRLRRAADLPGGRVARDAALAALRRFLGSGAASVAGLDAPFSLAAPLIEAAEWETFAATFTTYYPTPEELFAHGQAAGRGVRRATDRPAQTPFAPHNLRLYRQTWHLIDGVLAPLALSGHVRAAPMQPDTGNERPTLIEVCPASTLKMLGLYHPYKGASERYRRARQAILRHITALGWLADPELFPALLGDAEGDALDAALAAFATVWATQHEAPFTSGDPHELLEGIVYGWRGLPNLA